MRHKKLFAGVATLIGTIIGAGIFGLPYTIAKAGFIPGTILLLLIAAIVLITHLCYGEVVLRTKGRHQMAGYAEEYLGKWGKYLISFSLIAGIYGALLAYMVGAGKFLEALFAYSIGGSAFLYSLIFFAVTAVAVLIGLRIVASIELILVGILIAILFVFFTTGFSHIETENFLTFDYAYLLFPFGVLMFAFTGGSAIPQVRHVLKGEEKFFKKAIIWGTVIPVVVYFAFVFITVGITGMNTTDDAMVGLGNVLGKGILIAGVIFGILSITTSSLTLGVALKNIYRLDYKIDNFVPWVLTISVPLVLFLVGATDFIKILEIVGGVTVGLTGILLLLMYMKAKKKSERKPEFKIKIPKAILYLMIGIYAFGMIYVVVGLIGLV